MEPVELPNEKVHLLNAKEQNAAHPKTFETPPLKTLNNLKEGDFVKIGVIHDSQSTIGERFWVEVLKVNKDLVTGRLDNDLVSIKDIKYDDIISFHKDYILSTLSY